MKSKASSFLKVNLLIAVLCICFSHSGYAQSASPAVQDSVKPNQAVQYVKVEVGMHILDCPVLPPQFKAKVMTIKGIQDYHVDRNKETILFSILEGVVTPKDIVAIAVNSGFPVSAVNVIIDSKPFTN